MKAFTKFMKEKQIKSSCLGVIAGLSKRIDVNVYILKLLVISLFFYAPAIIFVIYFFLGFLLMNKYDPVNDLDYLKNQ